MVYLIHRIIHSELLLLNIQIVLTAVIGVGCFDLMPLLEVS